MSEGDDLKMSRADFEKAVKQVLSAKPRPLSKTAKRKKAKQKRKAS